MSKLRSEQEVLSRNMGFKYRASFNVDNQVEYEGWAINPTVSEGDLKWQIIKHTYTSGNLTASDWAKNNGKETDDFIFSWTLRISYF
jgi:hypothetical protein